MTLIGGKLTAYRVTAQKVMRELRPYLVLQHPILDTREITLCKAPDEMGTA